MYEAKSLLDIKMDQVSYEDAKAMVKAGKRLTPASLYAPEHAPKGTRFIMVVGKLGKTPYRVWDK